MRLRTKLVLVTTALTFALVLVLSVLFLGELLRQRLEQTADANDVLAHQVLLSTRQAIENGLRKNPPSAPGDEAFHLAVADALRSDEALKSLMESIVRYSPAVQDVFITNANRAVLTSTDPVLLNQSAPYRTLLSAAHQAGMMQQARIVFGPAQVLDLPLSLDRNGSPFLTIHVGVRSSLLRNAYVPLLRAAILFSAVAILGCIVAAALLSTAALRPIEQISRQLEDLTLRATHQRDPEAEGIPKDAVVRVAATIDRLGRQLESSEQQHIALESNLNKMLHTLKDGVMLFTSDGRVVIASEAVSNFLPLERVQVLNASVETIFANQSALDLAVRRAFAHQTTLADEEIQMDSGRTVELSIDFITGSEPGGLGALLTLHDAETEQELEREIEVSRRLAAIGRLTAGVGHEVKNPINAMVVHLELLRGKLAQPSNGEAALRHVEILSSEMQRLDRVVQALADFSRPIDLHLHDHDLGDLMRSVLDLASAEVEQNDVRIQFTATAPRLPVRVDADLIRQAILNIFLNAVQAMPDGGELRLSLYVDQQSAVLSIQDEGDGIPVEARPRIFDLYFTTKVRGSGIGLAMTYRIVQLHGGALEFTSRTPQEASSNPGTEFLLRLPLAHKLVGNNHLA
ncbi:sensor histidine kinase [Terriglobus saanensis]|uniref:histidine kinase n=1 Tax=Terriglobus saanensis (strain ATCC BAA-1853 / DSM 23119 / SP1PR4) TaxID=401053 RepID=E8V0C0_TERSS|nr:ATP-binding protein [Terriglobus saanensis]ADV83338.1 integral membrane sensor signal transduction histidine kinase [Terriglobus saanensis SP1PR4]